MAKKLAARVALMFAASSCVVPVESSGGETQIRTAPLYCKGAVDCPVDNECAVWWCQQIQTNDDDYGRAWGRCNVVARADWSPCGDGDGMCDNLSCRAPR